MKFTVSEIDNLLVHYDVEGLIEAGAPNDEYQDESAQIAVALNAIAKEEFNHDTVLAIIAIIWMNSFELSDNEMKRRIDELRKVTNDILAAT